MKTLQIIGNSHVGALRMGWDLLAPEWGDRVQVKFFAAPAKAFTKLKLEPPFFGVKPNSGISPKAVKAVEKINGVTQIDLSTADVVLLVGRRFGQDDLPKMLTRYSIGDIGRSPNRKPLSVAAFRAWVRDRVTASNVTTDWIRPLGPRLAIAPAPRPSETVRSLTGSAAATEDWARPQLDEAAIRPALDLHEEEVAAMIAKAGARLLLAPADTLAPNGLTASQYSRDSKRLIDDSSHDAEDHHHMNAEWGKRCLETWLPELGLI